MHVKSSKNGRVFCLVFSSDEKYFFWLQEKNEGSSALNELSAADKAVVGKFEELLSSDEGDEEDNNVPEDEDVEMDAPADAAPKESSN